MPSISDRLAGGVQRSAGDTFVDGTLSLSPLDTMPRPAATGVSEAASTQNLATTAFVLAGGPKGTNKGGRSQLAQIDLVTGVLPVVGTSKSNGVVDLAADTP